MAIADLVPGGLDLQPTVGAVGSAGVAPNAELGPRVILTADGQEIPVEIDVAPLDDPSGPQNMVIVQDIRERIAAQGEARR
ncbi:hypothetical protein N9D66_00250 [Candidatus Nanopelagicales bacterium]|nr:hypothetical protein [Candidatus Nanopelagicales bacterium]